MTAREVVSLNEVTPQLEVPQAGDTYEMPRDVNITGDLTVTGNINISDKGTADVPFWDYQATADADAVSAISTLTTSGSTTHHIQVAINGVTAWIAVSTTDPT